jgi:hypothetical protein
VDGPPPGRAERARLIATPDQRLRVFISSTMVEPAAERRAVREAVTRLRLIPVLFESGARAHPPQELHRAHLAQSEDFVGIYGKGHGWAAPGMEVSVLYRPCTPQGCRQAAGHVVAVTPAGAGRSSTPAR